MKILKGGKQLFSKFCEGFYSLLMRKTFNFIRRGMNLSFTQLGGFDIYFQHHVELR
jgi:hypothetical protein